MADSITLSNGDSITGSLVAIKDNKLLFDAALFGRLEVDQRFVSTLETEKTYTGWNTFRNIPCIPLVWQSTLKPVFFSHILRNRLSDAFLVFPFGPFLGLLWRSLILILAAVLY